MFENLSDRLERSFKLLKGEGKITELNVAETLKDVRRALLDADVNYKVAKQFTDTVKTKAMGQNVLTALKPNQVMVKIVHDELATLMGASASELELKGQPAVILMAGLQGSGKTTFSGKLAGMLRSKKGKKPLLAACDVYRPAAIDQLHVLGEQLGVPVYSERENKNPVEIAEHAIAEARRTGRDLVIIDTAGRLAVDEQMMQEIAAIKQAINPDETLFVVDSMTGSARLFRRGAHEARWRYAWWCGALDPHGGRQAHQVHRHGRKDGGARCVPSRTYGRPYPRHGRRGLARGARTGTV